MALLDPVPPVDVATLARAVADRDASLRLSPHFTLGELVRSPRAEAAGIDNFPDDLSVVAALAALVATVLEPLRVGIGAPVRLNSGYRCERLNALVGGVSASQHLFGQAADIEADGWDNFRLARWIEANLPFDQLILEGHTVGVPGSGWVHVSWRAAPPCRRQAMTMSRGAYAAGLIESYLG